MHLPDPNTLSGNALADLHKLGYVVSKGYGRNSWHWTNEGKQAAAAFLVFHEALLPQAEVRAQAKKAPAVVPAATTPPTMA